MLPNRFNAALEETQASLFLSVHRVAPHAM
jgi:hypothetical protein